MGRREYAFQLLGIALMAYFGSAIERVLFPGDGWSFAVPGFALGIAIFAQGGVWNLRARVVELERKLATFQALASHSN